jgi:hypothetical protein
MTVSHEGRAILSKPNLARLTTASTIFIVVRNWQVAVKK